MTVETAAPIRYRLRLKKGRERSLELGHPWLFTGAIDEIQALPGAESGDLGDVVDSNGRFLARGTVQPDSQIVCRILVWEDAPIDRDFFVERLAAARRWRDECISADHTDAYRLVHSEGDELPGLIVDRYGPLLVVQTLTAGMHRLQPLWLDALEETLAPEAIVERGQEGRREPVADGPAVVLRGSYAHTLLEVREHGLRYRFDALGGQKTGLYLDQRENRALVRRHAAGARVLDLFGYVGGFGIAAGAGGAAEVTVVDSSAPALAFARVNWESNGLAPELLRTHDVDGFEFLRRTEETWDRIVLDPPPLARTRTSLERALRAYKDLNLWALVRARPGALIWTFTCSQQVSHDLFQKVVFGAARDVGASVQWLARLGAGPDHPVHLDHPQGEYLKGLWLRVLQPGRAPRPRERKS